MHSINCRVLLTILFISAALLLTGCGNASSDIAGEYVLDVEAMQASAAKAMDDAMKESGFDLDLGGDLKVTTTMKGEDDILRLNPDGTVEKTDEDSDADEPKWLTGTWSADGDTVTINIPGEDPDTLPFRYDDGRLHLIIEDMPEDFPLKIIFVKK